MANKKDDLATRLIEITGLLVGVFVVKALLEVFSPLFLLLDERLLRILYIVPAAIANTCFALVIYHKLRLYKNAVSIGILSIASPVFGSIFYLLTISFTYSNEEQPVSSN